MPVCNRSLECSTAAEEHLQKGLESVPYCRNCKVPDVSQNIREEFEAAGKDSVSLPILQNRTKMIATGSLILMGMTVMLKSLTLWGCKEEN